MKLLPLITFIVFGIDFLTKQLVVNLMIEYQSITIIKNFFYITFAKNTGVAFSFLEGEIPLVIIMTSIIILLILKYIKTTNPNKYELTCYSLIIGGAIGNLFDRIIFGYVIDFFDFNIFGYSFPIFNIADTAIVIGTFLLIILNISESRNKNEINSPRKNKDR